VLGESGLSVELAPHCVQVCGESSPPLPGKAVSDAITRGPWNVREPAGVTTVNSREAIEEVFRSEVLKKGIGEDFRRQAEGLKTRRQFCGRVRVRHLSLSLLEADTRQIDPMYSLLELLLSGVKRHRKYSVIIQRPESLNDLRSIRQEPRNRVRREGGASSRAESWGPLLPQASIFAALLLFGPSLAILFEIGYDLF
jgi:hypothetical protein